MEPTRNRSLPPELQVMRFQLRMMELTGLVGPQGRFHRFLLAFGWGTFIIIFPKIVLGMGSNEFDVIIKGLSELLFQVNLYASAALLVLKLPSFKRMVQLLSEIIQQVTDDDESKDCYDQIREQNSKLNKFSKFYFTYCCFGPFIYCIPALGTSYVRYFGTTVGNGSKLLQFELAMEQEFYGLKIRTNFVHYHLFMVLSLTAYCICSYLSVIKVTSLLSAIRYNSLTYRLVAIRVRRLQHGGQEVTISSIDEIVKLHRKAFELTGLVEEIVNVPLAMQFMTCILVWCLVMFYVSTNVNLNLFNVMVPFGLSMIETYGYAYLGSELTAEAQAVGQAIYELSWYEASAAFQRYYRLIIQRAQCATGITAVKFFLVGIDKFGRVIQMSYSYYLVLRDVFSK
ncbi:uncharacterized protein LOC135714475 [Ochlerotatus camptorhynchus]|uniref:uncharacterized protein LOC135714475 n=1 Tax=Ochlerotatus camptorhynchus TaxID=644619 RepID=UPI0031DEB4CA